jgi:hypothetical protein
VPRVLEGPQGVWAFSDGRGTPVRAAHPLGLSTHRQEGSMTAMRSEEACGCCVSFVTSTEPISQNVLLICCRKSTPPQHRRLNIEIRNSKQ